MSSSSIDYAAAFGIHSVAAAAIFAVLFFPLGIWFVRQSIKNTTYVYIILTLFCAMRVTAYIIRAIIANSTSAGSNLNLFIADQVLFGVGFFALLYSAYTLVLDRDVLTGGERGSLYSPNLLRNPHAFRIILMAGVALGIVGTVDSTSSNPSDISTGHTLRKASIIIFLILTIVQVGQTFWFFKDAGSKSSRRPWGDRNGRYLICLISLLMLVREVFLAATLDNSVKQNNEHLWAALKEAEKETSGSYNMRGV
ncbi:hypothetical protein MVEN_01173900 [Mycena venus]|uniref:DUF7702 domain-containing protein n=1 Tax=Mycena venus TaxID=2733690 RepID=A0A8H6Y465_9AGAR|nr:hypothetical protein MVEN_01173900 [Mycena venus]